VKPAKTAQKRDDATYTGQISQRYAESGVVRAKIARSNRVHEDDEQQDGDSSLVCSGRYTFEIIDRGATYCYYKKTKKRPLLFNVDPLVTEFLLSELEGCYDPDDNSDSAMEENVAFAHQNTSYPIKMWTEFKVSVEEKRVIIRSHPNFEGGGPWYDTFLLPCGRPVKVVAFFADPRTDTNQATHMIVQEAMAQSATERENESQLFRQWRWRSEYMPDLQAYGPSLKSYPLSNIGPPAYCIDAHPTRGSLTKTERGHFSFFEAIDQREHWASRFLDSTRYLPKKMG
jgi:hypothetical protein